MLEALPSSNLLSYLTDPDTDEEEIGSLLRDIEREGAELASLLKLNEQPASKASSIIPQVSSQPRVRVFCCDVQACQ
jgi:hypothetical protein